LLKLEKIARFLAVSTLLAISSVFAAEQANVLTNIKGDVLVNQGESYTVAKEGMQLNPGDQLMVMDGGMASIEFADGCRYKVNGNEILRIDTQSTCAVNASKAVGPYYAQIGGGAALSKEDKLALGTGAAAVIALSLTGGGNKKTPISP